MSKILQSQRGVVAGDVGNCDMISKCGTWSKGWLKVLREQIILWKGGTGAYKLPLMVTTDHPFLWKFIRFLQTEEVLTKTTDEQITSGQTLKLEKQDQKNRTLRIQTIMADYDNRELLDYMRGISYNLGMPV